MAGGGGRVAEGVRLKIGCAVKSTMGSNPIPSAVVCDDYYQGESAIFANRSYGNGGLPLVGIRNPKPMPQRRNFA